MNGTESTVHHSATPSPHHFADSPVGAFAIRHRLAIVFITIAVCLGGVYCALRMPSSVFPETEFPRCVVLIDNGVMPADEMMATITRPIEEAMKDIPGVVQVRSATGRGSAEVNVFFNWRVNMVESELYVLNRVSQLKASLPATAKTTVWRLTFNAFPILGVSLTSPKRDITELWEVARYDLKPRFLRIPGVARVDLVGGRTPEYHVIVDPLKLAAANLALTDVTAALEKNNLVAPAGFHMENYTIYLALVDSRVKGPRDIEEFVVMMRDNHPVRIRDFARVERGPEPVFNVVNAQGRRAVLMNIRAQPTGSSILQIADDLKRQLAELRRTLPPDMELSFYYDQSLLVKESVSSVWESIIVGLIFAVVILYLFLKNWGSVLTAVVVIPVCVLATVVAMLAARLTFNLMTLGGIAAAIGLIIDDAIVVVEAIYARVAHGESRLQAIRSGIGEILHPLIGSTLTPVVVFIPLAFLDGLPGVFFRSLALTMVVALLTSLVLAVTLTPALASFFLRDRAHLEHGHAPKSEEGGFLMRPFVRVFEAVLQRALQWRWVTLLACLAIGWGGWEIYNHLPTGFMPDMDEGGFVIDCLTPWGTSLEETDRMMQQGEAILLATPEVEGYSRRTGARLALAVAEPNKSDFLVKLRPDRKRSTEEVKQELRRKFNAALPGGEWEFPGILGDLIGDMLWSPKPIEIKLFSTDTAWLMKKAPEVKAAIEKVKGVVDTFDGLRMTGPTISFRIRATDALRHGLTSDDIAAAINTAMLGRTASSVLEGDRMVEIRVVAEPRGLNRLDTLRELPLRTPTGGIVKLSQVADITEEGGQLEMAREDLRQLVAVTAALENRDMGSGIAEIKQVLAADKTIPPGVIEFGGLFQQQEESFRNLLVVLFLGTALVFTVLLLEFRSFREPVAIVFGSLLALTGTVGALALTGTTLNIVSFLGAIIGVGIVAKNGILMLDLVGHHLAEGASLEDALVRSAHRRLRPILMTSLTTVLAMVPLAWGIGHGADMLRPLAIGIIGALCISMLFSLIATPIVYCLIMRLREKPAVQKLAPHE
ncbi:MAG: efflux RND transporter permease subunit [Verrucomicrobiae bacterium]|nr:efflux RND transporter permease subunit [Verrucomicrobiae bacterium]